MRTLQEIQEEFILPLEEFVKQHDWQDSEAEDTFTRAIKGCAWALGVEVAYSYSNLAKG